MFAEVLTIGVFRNLKGGMPEGTFQVHIFKSVQILAYFFHAKNYYKFCFTSKGAGARPPKYAVGCDKKLAAFYCPLPPYTSHLAFL